MFKLVVLSALFVAAMAKPSGLLYGGALTYSYPSVAIPTAVSHQSRVDVINKPVVATTYAAAAPVVAEQVVVEPAVEVKAAPAIAVPTAVSHQSRIDVINKPVVATTYAAAAPSVVVAEPQVVVQKVAQPQLLAYSAVPSAVSHQSRVDLVNSPVYAHYGQYAYAAAAPHYVNFW